MMCGWMLKSSKPRTQPRKRGRWPFAVALQQGYGTSLKWVLNHTRLVGGFSSWHRCAEHLALYRHP